MNFYLNVANGAIVSASNERCTDGKMISYEVSETIYYNYLKHEDRYKIEDGRIVEDAEFIERFKVENKAGFEKEFFETSLGWIRRNVSMATGEKKDFLSDLLPAISQGLQYGQAVEVIVYALPDFSKELTDEYMETLQSRVNATAAFVQECFVQIKKDFAGITR